MATLPAGFKDIPRVKLLYDRPSDVEPLERLTSNLNCGATFWIKRDDCNSGLAYGGNKVRKLEYVLADAIAQGADTIVTTGGIQSNHMRQTAAAAARLGLKVAVYPRNAVKSNDAEYLTLGNVQLDQILGAELFPVDTDEAHVIETLKSRGNRPYYIPTGASTHPLGGLGYARWAFELLEQEAQLGIAFDSIAVTAGSCSTLGGMVAGFKLAQKLGLPNSKKKLLGYAVIPTPKEDMENQVQSIAKTTASKIGLSPEEITHSDFEINYDYIGGAYGALDQHTAKGIKELARLEGILLDPVYTGKTFTGMLHTARAGGSGKGGVLFCHTGGQAVMSAYPQFR